MFSFSLSRLSKASSSGLVSLTVSIFCICFRFKSFQVQIFEQCSLNQKTSLRRVSFVFDRRFLVDVDVVVVKKWIGSLLKEWVEH